MRAMALRGFGSPDSFVEIDLPTPELRPGHALLRVAASSVNPVDTKIRAGGRGFAPDLPAVLHGDVAGVVEAVAGDVEGFEPGDAVFGCAGGVKGLGGALAEQMLVDARLIARKPASLSMEQAAALPLVSITAWEGLIDRARVGPGQRVLVHGGAGGVGHIAVQIAKSAGATVYATVSSEAKAQIARDLGADVTIDYTAASVDDYVDAHTDGSGFDVVFDSVGGANLERALQAARVNGTVVTILAMGTHPLDLMHAKGLTLHAVFMLIPMLHDVGRAHHGEILRQVAELADTGRLRPLIDDPVHPVTRVADAHARLESGQAVGKVVLSHEVWQD